VALGQVHISCKIERHCVSMICRFSDPITPRSWCHTFGATHRSSSHTFSEKLSDSQDKSNGGFYMVTEGPCSENPDIFTSRTIHLMMLSTMGPHSVLIRLSVVLTCWIVAELLCLLLVKIAFHEHPLSIGSHAKKGTFYPIRRLNSMAPSYTIKNRGSLSNRNPPSACACAL
jgi:hypothetical protein